MTDLSRPTAEQLSRSAIVYIRQSSPGQVARNVESRELQYEFTERAVLLGWHQDQVIVIDDDLGHRGSQSSNRSGFQRLVAKSGSVVSGWCSGSRSRGWRGETLTGTT